MKKLLLFLLLSVGLKAQFNYQAIVKDSEGNNVTNNQVKFKFSLIYQSSTASPVYLEEHELITPPDGVVNLSIGGGTVVNGIFSDIDWSQNVFMKEELDTGSGYQDMGTRQIASVPVAEYAKQTTISSSTFFDEYDNFSIGSKINLSPFNTLNYAIGNNVLNSNDLDNSAYNIGLGPEVLTSLVEGSSNIGIGDGALSSLSEGDYNIAIGDYAMVSSISGSKNISLGDFSLANNEADNNIAIGSEALSSNVSGTYNLAIGNGSLMNNLSGRNLAIGASSLENNTLGTVNTAIGFQSLLNNQTGSENTAIGDSALYDNITGSNNVSVGRSSLENNQDGSRNVAVGDLASYNNVDGINNTSLGSWSLFNNRSGNYNVAVGFSSIGGLSDSSDSNYGNVGVGAVSLEDLSAGNLNVGIGHGSGQINSDVSTTTVYDYSTFIGAYTGVSQDGIKNATAIGANAIVTTSNTIQLGNTDVTLVNTSGKVSATSFKGNADELIITDSGTFVTLLDKIAELERKIKSLELNQNITLNLGSRYGGGRVFYIFQEGDPGYVEGEVHGLIIADEDLDETRWTLGDVGNFTSLNISNYDDYQTSTHINAGSSDTDLLIDFQENITGSFPAVNSAYHAEINGFDDWYLPSLGELVLIRESNDPMLLDIAFSNGYYWTSSLMSNFLGAMALDMNESGTGGFCGCAFFESYKIRPIRKF